MNKLLILVVPLLMLAGCGGGILDEKVADYDSLIESGWEKYNQYKYDAAYQLFVSAKKQNSEGVEAHIGSGWSLLRRQHPDSAIVAFRTAFDYVVTLDDSVDTITGITGSYLARGDNSKVLDVFKKYLIESYEDIFPLKKHDFFIDESDLEIAQAMACYRLKLYSSTEIVDPDNALYHLNQVLVTPASYIDPETLLQSITDYIDDKGGDF